MRGREAATRSRALAERGARYLQNDASAIHVAGYPVYHPQRHALLGLSAVDCIPRVLHSFHLILHPERRL